VSVVHAGLAPLRERPFRLLFLGRTLSGIGDAIVPVALTFAVLDLGDATDLGLVLGSSSATRVVFLVAGGVWADRLPRQLVMMASDVLRAAVQSLLALAFFTDTIEIWQLALGAALFGASGAFFNPASTGLVPDTVSPERLQAANALMSLSRTSLNVLGPAIGGIAGGLVVLRLRPSRPLFVAYAFSFATPTVLVGLAVPLPLAPLVAGSALIAVAIVLVNTFWATMLQQHVPGAYLSRVDSLGWMISLVAFPIGSVVAGPLAGAVGLGPTLVGAALLMAVGLVGALATRDFRNLRRLDDNATATTAEPL
jgi:MFS family permease